MVCDNLVRGYEDGWVVDVGMLYLWHDGVLYLYPHRTHGTRFDDGFFQTREDAQQALDKYERKQMNTTERIKQVKKDISLLHEELKRLETPPEKTYKVGDVLYSQNGTGELSVVITDFNACRGEIVFYDPDRNRICTQQVYAVKDRNNITLDELNWCGFKGWDTK